MAFLLTGCPAASTLPAKRGGIHAGLPKAHIAEATLWHFGKPAGANFLANA
jgi:hypothetical protein